MILQSSDGPVSTHDKDVTSSHNLQSTSLFINLLNCYLILLEHIQYFQKHKQALLNVYYQ